MTLVECCLGNVTADLRQKLHESDHRVREAMCLDRCGQCCDRSFLIVDGTMLEADSPAALLSLLERRQERDDQ